VLSAGNSSDGDAQPMIRQQKGGAEICLDLGAALPAFRLETSQWPAAALMNSLFSQTIMYTLWSTPISHS
jgi:hypothetical protein